MADNRIILKAEDIAMHKSHIAPAKRLALARRRMGRPRSGKCFNAKAGGVAKQGPQRER